jgi:hypothetical protein
MSSLFAPIGTTFDPQKHVKILFVSINGHTSFYADKAHFELELQPQNLDGQARSLAVFSTIDQPERYIYVSLDHALIDTKILVPNKDLYLPDAVVDYLKTIGKAMF